MKEKTEKLLKIHKLTNFRPKLSLCLFVIDPVKSNDKFIDIMGLDENYLLCIFMNINKNVENLERKRDQRTIGPENAHLKPDLGVLSHNEMTLTLNTHTPLLTS